MPNKGPCTLHVCQIQICLSSKQTTFALNFAHKLLEYIFGVCSHAVQALCTLQAPPTPPPPPPYSEYIYPAKHLYYFFAFRSHVCHQFRVWKMCTVHIHNIYIH